NYPPFIQGRSAMTRIALLCACLSAMLALALPVAPARAQSNQTFVSSTGNNSGNNCASATNPCQTIGQALQNTASVGQVTCLTPLIFPPFGVQISQSVTIDCPTSLSFGALTINGAGIVVKLRNITINGIIAATPTLSYGINAVNLAALFVERCHILGYAQN